MNGLKVYLSGHMPKEPGEYDWRQDLMSNWCNKVNHYTKVVRVPDGSEYAIHTGVRVDWLCPKNGDNREISATKDKYFMNICDMSIVMMDLEMGRCLGAVFEMGYLQAHHKPIILINHSKDVESTWFLEHNSSIVVDCIDDATDVILDIVSR